MYKKLGYTFYALGYIICISEIIEGDFPYKGFSIGWSARCF